MRLSGVPVQGSGSLGTCHCGKGESLVCQGGTKPLPNTKNPAAFGILRALPKWLLPPQGRELDGAAGTELMGVTRVLSESPQKLGWKTQLQRGELQRSAFAHQVAWGWAEAGGCHSPGRVLAASQCHPSPHPSTKAVAGGHVASHASPEVEPEIIWDVAHLS